VRRIGPDRSAQILANNLTYPSQYLFTQTGPYPRAAMLPELALGAIIGTVALIDCVPLEKVSTCSRIEMLALPANRNVKFRVFSSPMSAEAREKSCLQH
jgi:hypothetical protein